MRGSTSRWLLLVQDRRPALLDQEADLLNPGSTYTIQNFGNPSVPSPRVGPNIDFPLRALFDGFADFDLKLNGVY